MRKIDVIKNDIEHRELYVANGKEARDFTRTLTYGGYTLEKSSYWNPYYTERYATFEIEVDVKNKTFFIC